MQDQKEIKKNRPNAERIGPAKNCKENSTHSAWLMLNKEQILRKKNKS